MAQFCHQKIPLATSGLQCGRYHGPGECRLKSLRKRDDSGACIDAGVAMAGHNELVPGPVKRSRGSVSTACGSAGLALINPSAQTFLLLPEFGREILAEILGFKDLPNLDLRFLARHRIGTTLHPIDGLLQ